jgi:hypothetical protein
MRHCQEIHDLLPDLLYGELSAEEAAQVEKHLTDCPDCRREYEALQGTRQLLDAAPVPMVRIDLPRLYAEAAQRQRRRLRRWRVAACGLALAASILFLAVVLKCELRFDGQQIVFRWGTPPPVVVTPAPQIVQVEKPAINPEEMQLLKDLIHALAQDVENRDQRRQLELIALQRRLNVLQQRNQQQWVAAERDMQAMYAAQFMSSKKGEDQ